MPFAGAHSWESNGNVVNDVSEHLYEGLAQIGALSVADAPELARAIVQAVADLCVATIADVCVIYKRSIGPQPAAFASADNGAHADLATATHDDLFAERARAAGVTELLEKQLTIGGLPIGTIILGTTGVSKRRITPEMATLVASMLSTTIEQGRELSHHYHISTRLQKALLPSRLVQVPGMAFDAAYRPAEAEAEVGGDWFDAFEVGNGTIGISVGDVTGHGLEAAVTMSEIRHAIKAAVSTSSSPSTVINSLDAIMTSGKSSMATAIVGIYDPRTSVLRYASAGHPAPVIVTGNGRARYLPAGGTLLGIGVAPSSLEHTVTLSSGTSCLFYTDGLLEYNRDVISGEQILLDTIQRLVARGTLTAEALHAEIFRDVANGDDCATLALHHIDVTNPCALNLTFSSLPMCAALAREAVSHFAERQGIVGEGEYQVTGAVGEAVANAIEHGEHQADTTFTVEAIAEPDRVIVNVENPGHWRIFNARDERGRGIPIMRSYSSSLEIASTQDRTRITLTFER